MGNVANIVHSEACPCGSSETSKKGARVVCVACGRFLRWDRSGIPPAEDRPVAEPVVVPGPVPEIPSPLTSDPSPPRGPALYLSRRLEWFTVPAEHVPHWGPVVLIGSSPYYRVTAEVFTCFERSLLAKGDNSSTSPADKAEISAVWGGVVLPYAEAHLSVEGVRAARAVRGSLPPVPVVPEELSAREVPKHLAKMTTAA